MYAHMKRFLKDIIIAEYNLQLNQELVKFSNCNKKSDVDQVDQTKQNKSQSSFVRSRLCTTGTGNRWVSIQMKAMDE